MFDAIRSPSPSSEQELISNAHALAGLTLEQIAQSNGVEFPQDVRSEKGFTGQFIEALLGASAGSAALPDFPDLGIELKTIPIDLNGKPLESTYVSVVPMRSDLELNWQQSVVRAKLNKVLWMPIVGAKGSSYRSRIIGTGLLWQPNEHEQAILQQDWEDTMEKVSLGQFGQLNARFGEALQVRPKAANSRVTTDVFDGEGNQAKTLPRGFYLRPNFTQSILQRLSY